MPDIDRIFNIAVYGVTTNQESDEAVRRAAKRPNNAGLRKNRSYGYRKTITPERLNSANQIMR